MRQRVMIAMALALQPVAAHCRRADDGARRDDPGADPRPDARDEGRGAKDAAILLITHNLAVVAETCDRVAVMYGGKIQEVAPVEELFKQPAASLHARAARRRCRAWTAPKARAADRRFPGSCRTFSICRPGCKFVDALPGPFRAVPRHRAGARRERARATWSAAISITTNCHRDRHLRTTVILEVTGPARPVPGVRRRAAAQDGRGARRRRRVVRRSIAARRSAWSASPAAARRRSAARSSTSCAR